MSGTSIEYTHVTKTKVTTGSGFYALAGVAALIQLFCVFVTMLVSFMVGVEPTTADEYYTLLRDNRLEGLLRMDFPSLINVTLYILTMFAAFIVLRQHDEIIVGFGMALVCMGVVLALSTHSSFSLIHLSDQYEAATSDIERSMLLAAGEAVISKDWWHSVGGFMTGIFLQGGTVLISLIMLQSKHFSRTTAYAGILANGLDFIHVVVGLFLPGVGVALLAIGGLFYLVWYPLLGRDLYRLGQTQQI